MSSIDEKISKFKELQCFNDNQLEQIRLGLEKNIDVSVYAKPEFSSDKMELLRYVLIQGEDPNSYIENQNSENLYFYLEVFANRQRLYDICVKKNVDPDIYLSKKFSTKQIAVIIKGFDNGLNLSDINFYAKPEIDDARMDTIFGAFLDGLKQEDISKYVSNEFRLYQMYEIFAGLKSGVDVSVYAKPEITDRIMKKMRLELENKSKSNKSGIAEMMSGGNNE